MMACIYLSLRLMLYGSALALRPARILLAVPIALRWAAGRDVVEIFPCAPRDVDELRVTASRWPWPEAPRRSCPRG